MREHGAISGCLVVCFGSLELIMNREEFLAQRRKGIGGSDIAAVLGLSKWKTPYEVWKDKLGLSTPTPDNEAMLWGRELEPVIRQQYAERTGREVITPSKMLVHKEHPFLIANLDGFTTDNRIVEIKTARLANEWGEPGTDEVPIAYLLQVQHYMLVTGFEVADIAVLISGSDYRQYEIKADKELHDMLIDEAVQFWRCVETETPPAPVSYADAVSRYGKHSNAGEVTATAEIEEHVQSIKSIKERIKELEQKEQEHRTEIMLALGEKDTLIDLEGNQLVTWRLAKPTVRFDSKAFEAAHPELYKQFRKTGEASRRFLVK